MSRPALRRTALAAVVGAVLAALVAALAPAQASSTSSLARRDLLPVTEVWQAAQPAYAENPTNPLAGRVWGVYQGKQDQVSGPYLASTGARRELLAKIGERPRSKWYGSFVPDSQIREKVASYIAQSQNGDPTKLVQIAVFRLKPWEGDACKRRSTLAERRSYRTWIQQLAQGIGSTPMLVVMQPDMPFLWCAKDRPARARLLTWATRTLSALPATSVYLDAGAADWCENGKGSDPERCAQLLKQTGVRFARGFALDSPHSTGAAANIEHGARIVSILRRDGFGTKHFVVETAKSGRAMTWGEVVPAVKGGKKDNARVCRTVLQQRCVTLGIPPTTRVGDPRWGLSSADAATARELVDGFVWFGRPWLYNQADPFVMGRALAMATSTPWPGPLLPTLPAQ